MKHPLRSFLAAAVLAFTTTRHRAFLLAALIGFVAALPGRARAAVTSYSDPAKYAAASSGNTPYTFSGSPTGLAIDEGKSYTDGPLTFAAQDLDLDNDNEYGVGVGYLEKEGNSETITLSGATALIFTLGTFDGAQTIAISVNGAATTTVTEYGGHPNTMFVGFTDTVPITSLTFTDTTDAQGEIDVIGFQVGSNPNAVPEPSTWATMLGGLGLLGLAQRFRRTSAA